MSLTIAQIKKIIKKQLRSFSAKDAVIDDDTIIGNTIIKNPSTTIPNSKKLFEGNVIWDLWRNGHGKKKFPSNPWILSVSELADKLVILLLFLTLSITSFSQIQLNIGAAKTDLRKNAIQFAFTYFRSLDSAWGGNSFMNFGKKSWIMITPEIKVQTGTADALSSLVAKATGLAVIFQTTTDEEGLISVDADRLMHTFPLSLGVETNDQFNFINGIAELGYSPWYQSPLAKVPDWLKHTGFGVWLQAGYKWKMATPDTIQVGGKIDESLEQIESIIFRAKGSFTIDTRTLLRIDAIKMGLVGNADGWYDFIHGKPYYRLQGIARFYLSESTYFDLDYQKGSGAPNFNQGDQFGVGLTVTF